MTWETAMTIVAFICLAGLNAWTMWWIRTRNGALSEVGARSESDVETFLRLHESLAKGGSGGSGELQEQLASVQRRMASLEQDVQAHLDDAKRFWQKADARARWHERKEAEEPPEEENASDEDRAALARALGEEEGETETTSDLDAVRRRIRERGA